MPGSLSVSFFARIDRFNKGVNAQRGKKESAILGPSANLIQH